MVVPIYIHHTGSQKALPVQFRDDAYMLTLALNSSTVNLAGPPVNASVPTW